MAFLVILQATLIATIVTRAFYGASLAAIWPEVVWLALAFAARGALSWGFEVAGVQAAAGVLSELRLALVEQRLRHQPAALDRAESAELATVAVQGVDGLEAYFGRYLPQVVLACVVPVAVLCRASWVDLESGLVMLLTLPLVPLFMWLIGRYTEERTRARWSALRALSTHFLDVVRGLPTLRAFNRSETQAASLEAVGERYRQTTMGTLRVGFLSGSVLELAATLGVALVAVTVGIRLARGGIGLEAALTVLVLAPELYLPIRQLGAQFHASADGVAVAERLLDLIEAPPAVRSSGERLAPSPARATCGSRPSRSPTRHGPASCSTASISSCTRARPSRWWARAAPARPRSRACSCAWPSRRRAGSPSAVSTSPPAPPPRWRELLAWVPQRPTMFRGTVADNIRFGTPDADEAGVRESARLAGADAFVRASRRATAPSSATAGAALGRRAPSHRARARVPARRPARDPRRADGRSRPRERPLIATAVERLRHGRTVLLIAHRPELIRQADRVVVLERGRHAYARGERGCMSATTLRRLLQLADAPRGRVAVCVLFGALTVLFGAGLMATAGYLISRAAERPPILELTVAIVAVRFFGLARPIARYIERLASHDLAFRVLASVRVRVYRRIEPLAPTGLAAYRRGDLLARMVADVDALQNLHLRGILPPLVAAVAGAVSVAVTALFLPVAAAILAVGLLIGGVAVPALTAHSRPAPDAAARRCGATSPTWSTSSTARPSSWPTAESRTCCSACARMTLDSCARLAGRPSVTASATGSASP